MKFNNSKIKILSVVLLSCTLLLAGCKKTPTTDIADEEVNLIWWNLYESKENMQPIIDAYQDLHPNVTIDYAERDLSTYRLDLENSITDDFPETGPDIFTIHNSWVGNYESYLFPSPQSKFTETGMRNDFYDFIADDFVDENGLVLGVPLGVDTMAIIYNKELLEASGYTAPAADWDDFRKQAEALTTRNQQRQITTNGFSAAIPANTEFAFEMMNLFMLQSGGDILSEDGTAVFADDPNVQGAISSYASFSIGQNTTWDNKQEFDTAAFLNGKLAMYAAPSWRLLDIIKYNDAYNLGLDFGVSSVPQLESLTDERVYFGTYWGQVVSKDTTNSEVAWDFLNFVTSQENLRTLNDRASDTRAFGQIYPRKEMASEIENELLKPYVDSLPFVKTWEMVDGDKVKVAFDKFLELNVTSFSLAGLSTAQNEVNLIINNKGNLGSSPQDQ